MCEKCARSLSEQSRQKFEASCPGFTLQPVINPVDLSIDVRLIKQESKGSIVHVLMGVNTWIDEILAWLGPKKMDVKDYVGLKLIWDSVVLQGQIKDVLKAIMNEVEANQESNGKSE